MHIPRENEYISVHVSMIIYIYTGILGTIHLAPPLNIFSRPEGCTCLYSLYFSLFILNSFSNNCLHRNGLLLWLCNYTFLLSLLRGSLQLALAWKKWQGNNGWKQFAADGSGCQSGGQGNGNVAVHCWSEGMIAGLMSLCDINMKQHAELAHGKGRLFFVFFCMFLTGSRRQWHQPKVAKWTQCYSWQKLDF